MSTPTRVVILCRVSTSGQTVDRQVSELEAFAAKSGWQVVETITAQVSGSKVRFDDREDIQHLRLLVENGSIDKVLVHEVSRIGRRPSEVLSLVELCHEHGVSVCDFAQSSETLTAKGRPSLYANIILPLLAGLAAQENEDRRNRIMSGLAEARRKGKHLGRPKGSTTSPEELLAKHRDVVKRLKEGHSVRNAAKITGKGVSTVQRVRSVMAA